VIGGTGTRRTPRLAAMYADDFNAGFMTVNDTADQFARVRAACEAIGRDAATLVYSAAHAVCYARDEETLRCAAAIRRDVDRLRERHFCGTAAEVLDRLAQDRAMGCNACTSRCSFSRTWTTFTSLRKTYFRRRAN
jgi:alkanesulfonate monooxygenase SsuD/methylene tetrahydromethanopterin reductase-like flavin-dependent oxidoreductase (luciferase family)